MREVVPRALDGQRLDRVVALVTGASRSEAASLVDDGAVEVTGSVVTTRSHRVAEGDGHGQAAGVAPGAQQHDDHHDGEQRDERAAAVGDAERRAVVHGEPQAQRPHELDDVPVAEG